MSNTESDCRTNEIACLGVPLRRKALLLRGDGSSSSTSTAGGTTVILAYRPAVFLFHKLQPAASTSFISCF